MLDDPLWPTAVHEAGHAVVAYANGIRVRRITIVQRDTPSGSVRGETFVDECTGDLVDEHIIVAWAGTEAEARVVGLAVAIENESHKTDYALVLELGLRVTGNPLSIRAHIEPLQNKARETLDQPSYWSAVEALAERLLIQPTLTEDEVTSVIFEALRS